MGITLDDWACWLRNERGQAIIVRRKLTSHLPHPSTGCTPAAQTLPAAVRLPRARPHGSRNRQTVRLIALLAHAESALRRDHQRHRIQRIPHTTAGLRTRQGDLESGGWLNSPVAANRTAEFGRDTAQSAADLRQVGTGTGSTEVCIPEVGRGLRVQVRHGGLLGCGGACHRSSLTSNGFHDEQVKPVRRM